MPWHGLDFTRNTSWDLAPVFDRRRRRAGGHRDQFERDRNLFAASLPVARQPSRMRRVLNRIRGTGD